MALLALVDETAEDLIDPAHGHERADDRSDLRHLVRDADDQDRGLLDAYDERRARSGHDDGETDPDA